MNSSTYILVVPDGSQQKRVTESKLYEVDVFFNAVTERTLPGGSFYATAWDCISVYTVQLNGVGYLSLVTKKRLAEEFSQYKDTEAYQRLISRKWRR